MMDAFTYQHECVRTWIDKPDFELSAKDVMILWAALGMSGEAGELANQLKQGILHQHGVDVCKLKEEIGDTLYYLAILCHLYGLSLSDVMIANVQKLLERYPNGWEQARSVKREA